MVSTSQKFGTQYEATDENDIVKENRDEHIFKVFSNEERNELGMLVNLVAYFQ